MDVEEEIKEFRQHTKNIQVTGNKVKILTLEDIQIELEINSAGVFIDKSSVEVQEKAFDELGQLLTCVSPAYRQSFSNALIAKLALYSQKEDYD